MSIKKCTILICAFNAEKYIYDAIDSCYKSDDESLFEMIIVDDCSTDNTNKIINDYIHSKRKKILIIKNKINLGLTKSLNKGIKSVKTEFLARLDADDKNNFHRIEKQIKTMEQDSSLFCCSSDGFLIDDDGNSCRSSKFPKIKTDLYEYLLKKGNPFIHSSLMFRTKMLLDVGKYSPELSFRQDYELLIRSLHNNFRIKHLNETLIFHRISNNSISTDPTALIYGDLIRFFVHKQKKDHDYNASFENIRQKYFTKRSTLLENILLNERKISILKNKIFCKPRFILFDKSILELSIRALVYFVTSVFKPYLLKLLRKRLN